MKVIGLVAPASVALEGFPFFKGDRGELRGILIALFAMMLALCLLSSRRRIFVPTASLIAFSTGLGIVILLLHSPGALVFGLTPGNPADFDINYSGAVELYKYGGSPYAIEGKYQLENPSVSFPFPTYAIYWLCSGFGVWGKAIAALNVTLLNIIAALGLIWTSWRLSAATPLSLTRQNRVVLLLVAAFLVLASPLWLAVLEGQTPVLASCLMVLGLWYARKRAWLPNVTSGALLALGSMLKPNFAPLAFYFPLLFWRTVTRAGWIESAWRPLRIALLAAGLAILLVGTSLVFPRGMHLRTYTDFLSTAVPVLEGEAHDRRNMSLLGLANAALPTPLPPRPVTIVLLAASIAYGLWFKPSTWMVWLVIPLLISPITVTFYLGLALPVQFAIARSCIRRERFRELALLVASLAFLWAPRNLVFLGAIALIVLFGLALRLDPGDLIQEPR